MNPRTVRQSADDDADRVEIITAAGEVRAVLVDEGEQPIPGWTPPTPERTRALIDLIARAITPPTRAELRRANRQLNRGIE